MPSPNWPGAPLGRTGVSGCPQGLVAMRQIDERMTDARQLVLSLHGIRTRGAWQKDLAPTLNMQGFDCAPLDYGNFLAARLLYKPSRRAMVDWFRDEYDQRCTGKSPPSVIAHSFGSYIVTEALRKYPHIKVDQLILCGSIVRRDYPWDQVLSRQQVARVLNDFGQQDIWAKVVGLFVSDAGPSGLKGFEVTHPLVHQRCNPDWQHSDYFHHGNYVNAWIPFLQGGIPPAGGAAMSKRWLPLLLAALLAGTIGAFAWPFAAPAAAWVFRSQESGLGLMAPAAIGLPESSCQAESGGSAFQLFENGWLVANHRRDVFYSIVKHPTDARLEWQRQPASGFTKGRRAECAGVQSEHLLRLGFRWWYCEGMGEAQRRALGAPITEESRAWIQFQTWTSSLLVYGMESTPQGVQNGEFQSLVGAFLHSEGTRGSDSGTWFQVEAVETRKDAYCTSIWYPARLDGGIAPRLRALERCDERTSPDRYRSGSAACSIFGF